MCQTGRETGFATSSLVQAYILQVLRLFPTDASLLSFIECLKALIFQKK